MLGSGSLQKRFVWCLIVPVTLLLIGMGTVDFNLASRYLMREWQQTTILQLQKSAQLLDTRINRAVHWITLFQEASHEPFSKKLQNWIIQEARDDEGIVAVNLEWGSGVSQDLEEEINSVLQIDSQFVTQLFNSAPEGRFSEVTSPRYDDLVQGKTVSIVSDFLDSSGTPIGSLEIVLNFDDLLQPLKSTDWWRRDRTCLVNSTGTLLAGSFAPDRQHLGETGDKLELVTLESLKSGACGTIQDDDYSVLEMSSFCRLNSIPWSLVIFSPTSYILAPIIHFRYLYSASVAAFVLLIVFLMRFISKGTLTTINNLSDGARAVAEGRFDIEVPVNSKDEVGQLAQSFNVMAKHLEERIRLKQALNLAMEVERSMLPHQAPRVGGIDIAGISLYCEETGGDYFDFLQFAEIDRESPIVAVGDVVGHGISAALLMTTVRGLLRGRLAAGGGLAAVITDVNRLLCKDTSESASFMTLFVVAVNLEKKEIHWVRAGHDPAIVYDPSTDTFEELKGDGVALGFDQASIFEENCYPRWNIGQVLLIGTDGIWEAENCAGEQFGKERLNEIMRSHAHLGSDEILRAVTEALVDFRGHVPQSDDVTLVVLKMTET